MLHTDNKRSIRSIWSQHTSNAFLPPLSENVRNDWVFRLIPSVLISAVITFFSILSENLRTNSVDFGWVGFLVACLLLQYNKSIPTHETLFAVGKSSSNATFNLIFSWVGLALGWGVRRFHNNTCMFSNPT